MQSSNQLTSRVFSDRKFTPIQAEIAQCQIGKNNKMLFHSPAVSRTYDYVAFVPYQKHETLLSSVFP